MSSNRNPDDSEGFSYKFKDVQVTNFWSLLRAKSFLGLIGWFIAFGMTALIWIATPWFINPLYGLFYFTWGFKLVFLVWIVRATYIIVRAAIKIEIKDDIIEYQCGVTPVRIPLQDIETIIFIPHSLSANKIKIIEDDGTGHSVFLCFTSTVVPFDVRAGVYGDLFEYCKNREMLKHKTEERNIRWY